MYSTVFDLHFRPLYSCWGTTGATQVYYVHTEFWDSAV